MVRALKGTLDVITARKFRLRMEVYDKTLPVLPEYEYGS